MKSTLGVPVTLPMRVTAAQPICRSRKSRAGFTLVEMALVLLILAVLARSTVLPFARAHEHRRYREAETQLESIRQAIWSHVVSQGALPCAVPLADAADIAHAEPSSQCMGQGGVSAIDLGLPGATDAGGALLDPWGRSYRYAVSLISDEIRGTASLPDWTTPGESSRVGIPHLQAELSLCTVVADAQCPAGELRAGRLVFVVLSTGQDASGSGRQGENLDGDAVFLLQDHTIGESDPFDDLLAWGTASDAIYWQLRAGWLP